MASRISSHPLWSLSHHTQNAQTPSRTTHTNRILEFPPTLASGAPWLNANDQRRPKHRHARHRRPRIPRTVRISVQIDDDDPYKHRPSRLSPDSSARLRAGCFISTSPVARPPTLRLSPPIPYHHTTSPAPVPSSSRCFNPSTTSLTLGSFHPPQNKADAARWVDTKSVRTDTLTLIAFLYQSHGQWDEVEPLAPRAGAGCSVCCATQYHLSFRDPEMPGYA